MVRSIFTQFCQFTSGSHIKRIWFSAFISIAATAQCKDLMQLMFSHFVQWLKFFFLFLEMVSLWFTHHLILFLMTINNNSYWFTIFMFEFQWEISNFQQSKYLWFLFFVGIEFIYNLRIHFKRFFKKSPWKHFECPVELFIFVIKIEFTFLFQSFLLEVFHSSNNLCRKRNEKMNLLDRERKKYHLYQGRKKMF